MVRISKNERDRKLQEQEEAPERRPPSANGAKKLLRVTLAALDRGALDPVLLDVSAVTSFADTVVLLSGRSDRQVRAIAESIVEALRADGEPPLGIEGQGEGRWVLIDGDDVIVHVFEPDVRDDYDLERLWSDAPDIDLLALGVPAQALEEAQSGRSGADSSLTERSGRARDTGRARDSGRARDREDEFR